MIWSVFEHEFKQHGSIAFGDWILWRKSLNLWNMETDENISFNSMSDVLAYELEGKTIKERIAEADMSIFTMRLDGGSGNGSGAGGKSFKFSHASMAGKDRTRNDLPARMNTKVKRKTEHEAIQQFRKKHQKDNYESGVSIDNNGFVNSYKHGNRSSISIGARRKGDLVVHNHPSGGHFSDADLISTAADKRARGVVATTPTGYHKFTKGTHFQAEKFSKAVKKANMKGSSYDDAVTKWLKGNEKKYGYSYEFVADKPAKKTSTTKKKSVKTTKPKPKKTISLSWDNNTGQGGFDF